MAAILLLSLVMAGCYTKLPAQEEHVSDRDVAMPTEQTSMEEVVESPAPEQPSVESTMKPNGIFQRDNISGIFSDVGVYPTENGFYSLSYGMLNYYDLDQQASFRACPLAGCSHRDETCPAKIPGMKSFFAVEGDWYALCENDTGVSLVKIQPSDGEKNIISAWDNTEAAYYSVGSGLYASNRIYVTLWVWDPEVENYRNSIDCVNLETGVITTIAECNEWGSGNLIGASEHYVLLDWTSYDEPLQTQEEYLDSHPGQTEDGFFSYVDSFHSKHASHVFRRYALETMEYTDLEEMKQAAVFTDPNCCFGNWTLYLQNETACLLDMETLERRELVTDPYLINGWLMDGRFFYLREDREHNGSLQEYAFDLVTGETALVGDFGDGEAITFSAHSETKTAFIGLYEGKHAWISKENFYAGRFDQVVLY